MLGIAETECLAGRWWSNGAVKRRFRRLMLLPAYVPAPRSL